MGNALFADGQSYVALSRVTSLKGLHLINFDVSAVSVSQQAISEYNRLRFTYRPDLQNLNLNTKVGPFYRDRVWCQTQREADATPNPTKSSTNAD